MTSVEPGNHYVVAQGRVGDAQRAFNVQLNRVMVNGEVHRARRTAAFPATGNLETTLDVEWAHAIAPDANIVLVVAANNSFSNLDVSNLYAVQKGYGSVISNSYGIPEIILVTEAPSELKVQNNISRVAAALGISQQVSSGDAGDAYFQDIFNFGFTSLNLIFNSNSSANTARCRISR